MQQTVKMQWDPTSVAQSFTGQVAGVPITLSELNEVWTATADVFGEAINVTASNPGEAENRLIHALSDLLCARRSAYQLAEKSLLEQLS